MCVCGELRPIALCVCVCGERRPIALCGAQCVCVGSGAP